MRQRKHQAHLAFMQQNEIVRLQRVLKTAQERMECADPVECSPPRTAANVPAIPDNTVKVTVAKGDADDSYQLLEEWFSTTSSTPSSSPSHIDTMEWSSASSSAWSELSSRTSGSSSTSEAECRDGIIVSSPTDRTSKQEDDLQVHPLQLYDDRHDCVFPAGHFYHNPQYYKTDAAAPDLKAGTDSQIHMTASAEQDIPAPQRSPCGYTQVRHHVLHNITLAVALQPPVSDAHNFQVLALAFIGRPLTPMQH
ncbi:hypothetical protein EMMF5_000597 [Cystobasidiomycetes sp. EMM_F5]